MKETEQHNYCSISNWLTLKSYRI